MFGVVVMSSNVSLPDKPYEYKEKDGPDGYDGE